MHRKQILGPQPCSTCRGRGSVVQINERAWYQFMRPATITTRCSVCGGMGTVPSPVAEAFEAHDYRGAVELVLNLS